MHTNSSKTFQFGMIGCNLQNSCNETKKLNINEKNVCSMKFLWSVARPQDVVNQIYHLSAIMWYMVARDICMVREI